MLHESTASPMKDQRLAATSAYIAQLQLPSGAIPWFDGGIVDPWDHVEAIMGLSIGGYSDQAQRGFDWLAHTQRPDGSWFAAYNDSEVADATRAETNFVAYVATGLWHHYQIFRDADTLRKYTPFVERALNYVLDLQTEHGDIAWAVDTTKGVCDDALVTGCSSIYKSFECMANIAEVHGKNSEKWIAARQRLGNALRERPERFDRTWPSKERFSMDWFYPILSGAVRGKDARRRLDARWHEFVEPGLGCRCVNDEPWVTMAETCELIMACIGSGRRADADRLFTDLQRFQLEDGSWWTGYVFTDDVHWPDERPAWTAAAILLAADALYGFTAAHDLFVQHRPENHTTAPNSPQARRANQSS